MRRLLSLVFIVSLLVVSVETSASAAKYKYIYKNGKKYKVRVKVKPKIRKSKLKTKRPLRENIETTNRFSENLKQNESDVREFFGFKGKLYGGVDLVMRSVSNEYSIKTNKMANEDNETYTLKFGETGTIMYTDGKTYSFSNSLSAVGLDFRGGFEMLNKDKVEANFYYDSEEINIGLGYKYVMPSLSFFGVDPYLRGRLLLAYKELSDIFGIVPNSFALGYGFGGERKFSDNIFINFGIDMSSKTWADESTKYTSEEKTTKDTSIYFGANYRL